MVLRLLWIHKIIQDIGTAGEYVPGVREQHDRGDDAQPITKRTEMYKGFSSGTAKSFQGQKRVMLSATQPVSENFAGMAAASCCNNYGCLWSLGEKAKGKIRAFGHKAGAKSVRRAVSLLNNGIDALTLYAFSSENWNRPAQSERVNGAVVWALDSEVKSLHRHNVRLRIGDISGFAHVYKNVFANPEALAHNTGLTLNIAADYGGHVGILSRESDNWRNRCRLECCAPIRLMKRD